MRHVTITPNGQKRVLLVQSGTLGLALKQMADTSVNAARAEAAAQEAEAARDDTISGLNAKASKDGSDITSGEDWRTALGLGGSSTLDVGSTAGTVAAGDDERLLAVADKANTVQSIVQFFRDSVAGLPALVQIMQPGTANVRHQFNGETGDASLCQGGSGKVLIGSTTAADGWKTPIRFGGGFLWVNAAGKAMIKAGATAPSSDADGVVIGTQT